MNGCIEVVEPGLAVALQDGGRTGSRRLGVPVSGALDPVLLALANALAGNEPGAAALEVPLSGPTLVVRAGSVRFALAGPIAATVLGAADAEAMPDAIAIRSAQIAAPWSTVTLGVGQTLKVGRSSRPRGAADDPRLALGYVAVSGGGFLVPEVLGSRSTYARAVLGGVHGRALGRGDLLPCAGWSASAASAGPERRGAAPFLHDDEQPIRLLAGPQSAHFEAAANELLTSAPFSVTAGSDRMGLRLLGPRLPHSALGPDIASDGVTPGAIQVPADGQPIVLLADCQTVGGYPKIATVIRADLPRLAHARAGTLLRFCFVTPREAAAARAQLAQRTAQWIAAIAPYRAQAELDETALYQRNLVSGAVRGDDFDAG